MSYLLDTNIVIAMMSGVAPLAREQVEIARQGGQEIAVSAASVFELWFGVAKSQRPERNAAVLNAALSPLAILDFDQHDARSAGELRARLARIGRPVGPYDLLIAAQALRRGLTLVTANERELRQVPGLRIENWAAS